MSRLNEKLKFRVSPEDVERIKVKMEDAGIMSMSAYIRKMALDGICVRMGFRDVRQLVILLRRCSNNLEQYARKANETGSVYAAEIANLQNRLDEIWELTRQSLSPGLPLFDSGGNERICRFSPSFQRAQVLPVPAPQDNSVREPNA